MQRVGERLRRHRRRCMPRQPVGRLLDEAVIELAPHRHERTL